MKPLASSVLILAFACSACSVEGEDPKADPGPPAPIGAADFAWDGVAMRSHRDAPSALAFPVPATGHRVTATHFDLTTPPIKMKHELTIAADRREVLRIDVWENTEALSLGDWFDKYLRFMATPDAVVEQSRAGRSQVPALSIRQPGSEQAPPRMNSVFALGQKVLRVTCIDSADPKAMAIYARVTAELALEGAP